MCEICARLGLDLHGLDLAGEAARPAAAPAVVSRGGVPTPNGKTSYTTDQAAAQLTRDSRGWSGGFETATTVTFAFRSTAPSSMPEDTGGFSRFTGAQIAAALLSLQAWSDVANIQFARIGDGIGDNAYSNNATILFANYSTGEAGAAAFAYYPGSRTAGSSAGDVWVNNTQSANIDLTTGAYGPQVLTHEIGHAIGLSHPGDYSATEGASPTYQNSAAYYEDSRQYSVMSYFASTNTGASLAFFAAAPQLDDIAAVQRLYGANMNTRLEDTTYGFNSTAERPWYVATAGQPAPVFAVWDAGGVDTLDFSGYGDAQRIDLRQGAFSDVGGSRYNIAVAVGAVIENAKGGSGVDVITGNGAANRLEGLDGADSLWGLAGGDQLFGGAGDDTLSGGADGDLLDGGEGRDIVAYTDAAAVHVFLGAPQLNTGDAFGDVFVSIEGVTGGAGFDLLVGHTGDDQLRGQEGNDWLMGYAGEDYLQGADGEDILIGGVGRDYLDGGAGADAIGYQEAVGGVTVSLANPSINTGEAAGDGYIGVESIWGSAYGDVLYGDGGGNQLKGFDGDDWLDGGAGADDLYGGSGADTLTGGAGADTFFYLYMSEGLDRIVDFEPGVDRIFVSRYWFGLAVPEYRQLLASELIAGPGARASGAQPVFVYDSSSGLLSFDPDGGGPLATLALAALQPQLAFTARDIWVAP